MSTRTVASAPPLRQNSSPSAGFNLRPSGEHPFRSRRWLACCVVLTATLAAGCSAEEGSSDQGLAAFAPSAGVSQGGAQDFGAFRERLDQSQLPTAELFDDVGFFNEHKIVLPEPSCDQPVCLHARLGVMGNMIDGANCTMLFIGMNTRLAADSPRQPLDLVLALDTSGSMAGAAIEYLILGLHLMVPNLQPDDRVSLITFDNQAHVLLSGAQGDWTELEAVIDTLHADGGTNIYAGLSAAYGELDRLAETDDSEGNHEPNAPRQRRVLLLSDGDSTAGFTDEERPVGLARAYTRRGISLSTIGVGDEFDSELLRRLSVEGAGSYYFIDEPRALGEVFTEELQTSLVPLARDAKLTVEVAPQYQARAVFGTDRAFVRRDLVEMEMPILQIAQRTSDSDAALGRRGGGGVIIVELTPRNDAANDPETLHDVGTVHLDYREANIDGKRTFEQLADIDSPLDPGETPPEGHFDDASVEKSFVMLNIYAGIHAALQAVHIGDTSAALVALSSLDGAVTEWLQDNPDEDIEADQQVVRQLADLVEQQAPPEDVQAASPPLWGYD